MTDTLDLEARLVATLNQVAFAVPEAPPGTWEEAKSDRTARQLLGPRPSRPRRLVLIGTGIAAAGLAAVLVLSSGGHGLNARTVAYRTVAAIKSANNLIEVDQRSLASPRGEDRFTVWRYNNRARIETFSPTGTPVTDASGALLSKTCATTCGGVEVIYAERSWFTLTSLAEARDDDDIYPRSQTSAEIASLVQKGIKNHTLKIGATESIDGRAAIDLSLKAAWGRTTHIWVDPATYLPEKSIAYPASQLIGTQVYSWLPPTPKNLALLDAVVPPGFTHASGRPPKG